MLFLCTCEQCRAHKQAILSLLHPTSAVEALLLMETSSSTAGSGGRVCIIRPDISLDNTVLPTVLKREGLSHFEENQPGLPFPSGCKERVPRPNSTPFHVLTLSSLFSLCMGNRQDRDKLLLLTEIALAQLDQLRLAEQMILKYIAVIVPVFTTQLLSHVVPATDRHKVNCLLDMLVSKNILR